MYRHICSFVIISAMAILSGCTGKADNGTLSVGLMPAVDSAPFFYAEKQGYFREAGVTVELTIYSNAQNRQTALQTNQIDGAMTDLVAFIINRAEGFPVRGTMITEGSFMLLKNSKASKRARPVIAMMEISVSNYLVSRYMEGKEYAKMFIPEIPLRLQAVISGSADMGLFPEPIASIGELQGLERLTCPHMPAESLDLMVFTEKALAEKKKSISVLHKAYARAAAELNADDRLARDILLEYIPNIPPAARDILVLPEYHMPSLPSEEFTDEMTAWTAALTGTRISVRYADLFDDRFVQR
ncbi:MAG: ABC transporter substrate-binding protein [Spirochaetales bacterium]|nr:ABC transporter substrate-binding protein [Spirochaetales bacterium]